MSQADYKGHKSLADMVSTHIGNWRKNLETLQFIKETLGYDTSYIKHELKALQEIEDAVNEDLKDEIC